MARTADRRDVPAPLHVLLRVQRGGALLPTNAPIEKRQRPEMSVTHLRRDPHMPNDVQPNHTDEPRPTDSELAAQWAAQALTDGRLELGRVLANIAVTAARVEAENARAQALVPAPLWDAAHLESVPCSADCYQQQPEQQQQDRGAAEAAQTEVFGTPPVQQLEVPQAGRCHHVVRTSAGVADVVNESLCWRPIVLEIGTPNPVWKHLDRGYDQHHYAVPPPELA